MYVTFIYDYVFKIIENLYNVLQFHSNCFNQGIIFLLIMGSNGLICLNIYNKLHKINLEFKYNV